MIAPCASPSWDWAGQIGFVWRRFASLSLGQRLFVLARLIVCPWHRVLEVIPEEGRLLDVGCGHGLLLQLIRRTRPGLSCVGVDISHRKIALARRASADGRLRFETIGPQGLNGLGSFDCVTLIDVLYTVPLEDWEPLLWQCFEHLRPGGRLIVKETIDEPRWKQRILSLHNTFAHQIIRYTKGSTPHVESADIYVSCVSRCGFSIERQERLDRGYPYPHWLLVAIRSA